MSNESTKVYGVIIGSPFHIELANKKKVLLVVPTSDMRTTINLHYFKHNKRRVELTVSPHDLGYFVHDFKEVLLIALASGNR